MSAPSITKTVVPTITSVGAPPEAHADRVVAEMLRFLVRGQLAREKAIAAVLNLPDGNPRAQAKIARKLEETGWPFVLNVSLKKSGKRGRYELCFVSLDGYSPSLRQVIVDEKDIPHKPWLAISLHWIKSRGNHDYDERRATIMLLTHHALSRLAQRSSVKCIWDLVGAVVAIWSAYAERFHDYGGFKFPEGHRLQFQLDGGGIGLAVLNHDRFGVSKNRVVVATII
jgi:hypothetical protein